MSWNFELYIDGKWTTGEAAGSIEVIDPATEEVIGSVPEATTKDAVRAIEAARQGLRRRSVAVDQAGRAGRGPASAWPRSSSTLGRAS